MGYTRNDFRESLIIVETREALELVPKILQVLAAWGEQEEGWAEWAGGFLLKLDFEAYPFAYVYGWCDTSGWGCQDGAYIDYFETCPTLDQLGYSDEWEKNSDEVLNRVWDILPADLNDLENIKNEGYN